MKIQYTYQIDRLTTLTELDALEKDWSELLDEIPEAPIFLTWEWIRTWWCYFGQDRELWLLTARGKQGRLLGIAPFMREEYKKGWIKLGIIAFIGTGRVCPTHLNILASTSDKEDLYRAFIDFLMGHSDQWDILRIASVYPNSVEYDLLMAAGGHIRIGAQIISPYITLPSDWETYLKTLSQRDRRNIKNARSKLEGDFPGMVGFGHVTDLRQIESAMKKLEEIIKYRCHAKRLKTDWDDSTFTGFHNTIAHLVFNHGWLRLYTLTVRERLIAILYCFRYKDCIYGYNGGYELDWSGYSPGRLLIAYSIQTAIREAARVMDMGRGDSEYKFYWTNRIQVENEILFSGSWIGNIWIKYSNFKNYLQLKRHKGVFDLSRYDTLDNMRNPNTGKLPTN